MAIKVGINGFGRIGRVIFRVCIQDSNLEVTAINDPIVDIDYICYLIKFDSTHGKFNGSVTYKNNEITLGNDHIVKVFHEKLPSNIQWQVAGVQYVVEASGMFTNLEKASGHLASDGVKRVVVTAPSVDVPMLILGVNDNKIHSAQKVISCASSTLYCLAPIIKVLVDNFGVSEGFITSIHAMTPSLKPLDGICLRGKHWRDHRSILQNIIPAKTGACKALGKIVPQVKDRLCGLAFRVPIANVSVLDLTIRLSSDTTLQDIVAKVEKESSTSMENIIKLSIDEAVSSDFIGDRHSCILDVESSLQLKPNFYKLVCWYENEYSYACRVIDSIIFSETQLRIPNPRCKMTYVRQKTTQKQNIIQQTENTGKKISIVERNNNLKVNSKLLSDVSQNVCFKPKPQPHPIVLKKPISGNNTAALLSSNNRDTKKRNEIFKIWNDDNDVIKSVNLQNRNSFFYSCVDSVPQPSTIKRIDNFKAQERLQKVKKEFSKMVNITEDLLKKSNSNKIQMHLSNRILEKKTNISSSELDNKETTNVKIIPIKECNKSQKRVSGDFESIITNNNSLDNNDTNINEHISSFSVFETTNIETTKSNEIQPLALKNNQKRRQLNVNDDTKKFKFLNPVNCEFKEHVAKTINTLIDGLSQNIQVQSVFIDRNRDKRQHRKSTNWNKLNNNINVHSEPRSNNDSGFFSPINKEFSEIEINTDNIFSRFQGPENVKEEAIQINETKEEALQINETMNNHNNINKSDDSIQDRIAIPLHKNEYKKQNKAETFDIQQDNVKNQASNDNLLMPLNSHKNITESKFETINIENEYLSRKTDDNNKGKILRKKILDSLNRFSSDPVVVISNLTLKCASPGNTITTVNYSGGARNKQDIYDKLDSTSATDSENSFQINERKSQVIHITDLTNSLEDLARLDKICKIIEISDELSDKLFSALDNEGTNIRKRHWSFKDLCERIKLDAFCNKIFGKSKM